MILTIGLSPLYTWHWEQFFIPSIMLVSGFVLFLIGIMGGGDAKFLSTFYLLIPELQHQEFLFHLLTVTAVLALGFLIYNIIRNRQKFWLGILTKDGKLLSSCLGTKFPFAPVIAVSFMWWGWDFLKF